MITIQMPELKLRDIFGRSAASRPSIFGFVAGAVLCVAFYYSFSINWPIAEDWLFADWYRRFYVTGELTWSQVLTASNGSHPLAAQMALSIAVMRFVGVNFAVILFMNALILLTGAFALMRLICSAQSSKAIRVATSFGIVVILFHPIQTAHILWPFEMGWFLITSLAVINICLIERYKTASIPAVMLLSSVASFSSAHGIFLFLAATTHFAILRQVNRHWLFAVLILAAGGLLEAYIFKSDARVPIVFPGTIDVINYSIQLIGSVFGTRNPSLLFPLGTATILASIYCFIDCAANVDRAASRVVLVLLMISGCFVGAFILGRYADGLPWALAQFHAGPLLTPLVLAIFIWSVGRPVIFPRNRSMQAATIVAFCFSISTILASVEFAHDAGRLNFLARSIAMMKSCNPTASKYLQGGTNSLSNSYYLYEANLPFVLHLCTQPPPEAKILDKIPALFVARGVENLAPLAALWDVYVTHGDLYQAFPPSAPNTPCRLLSFANADAIGGSGYELTMLKQHQLFFRVDPWVLGHKG